VRCLVGLAGNRCPHLGFSLTRGPGGLKYEDGVVQCPWHNSRFNVCTGENLDLFAPAYKDSARTWPATLRLIPNVPMIW
jgi:nitrite reductase/ring-hydroxylating ferredoxin subunit